MADSYQDPKREVELLICSILKEATHITFLPNKGDIEHETPFGAVLCESMKPLLGGAKPRGYRCDVRVVYVSHMDEIHSEQHAQNVSRIEDTLNGIPQKKLDDFYLTNNHVKIVGLFIQDIQESSEDHSFGDLFICKVAVVGESNCPNS